jgi:hypothetical protein
MRGCFSYRHSPPAHRKRIDVSGAILVRQTGVFQLYRRTIVESRTSAVADAEATHVSHPPGGAVARTGLRMMPTFPLLPLKFRRADFLRYGFKAGLSDGAFPSIARSSRRAVCVRPSCPSLAYRIPRSEPRDTARLDTSVRAVRPLYPRGPRSGPGYSVPAHPHLIDPIRPTRRHNSTSPRSGLYEMSPLCIGA